MNTIELLKIEKSGNSLRYDFRYSEELKKYFTGVDFCITYPDNIEQVPDGVLAIPFATNTLQIAWIADCELIIPELDRDFYESIPNFLDGFRNMYPETTFAGKLTVGSIVDHRPEKTGETASFFSGGLDATTTLLRHIDERPHLISIWGSDVDYDNETGWSVVENGLRDTASQYGLPLAVIRSRFREFDNVVKLTEDFGDILQTSWWYGVKHGIGLLGHAAPYAWLHGVNMVYIASSHCPENGKVRCASDPSTDSELAFCNCSVFHDAYELNRQKKTRILVDYQKKRTDIPIHLHVCWKSNNGSNCSCCEKCYRTMAGIWIEGDDPKKYGFDYDKNIFKRMYQCIALRESGISKNWKHIQQGLRDNWEALAGTWYRDQMVWMLDFDFAHPEENECRKRYRATWRYKDKLVKAFPRLYRLYIKLRGYRFE